MKYALVYFFNSGLERKNFNNRVDNDYPEYHSTYKLELKGMEQEKVYECIEFLLS